MSTYQFPSPGGGTGWYSGAGAPSTLHNDGDFYLNTSNGDLYKQAAGAWGSPVINVSGSSPSRSTVTKTTASLANGASEQSTVTIAKTFSIAKIVVDGDCRVRLYSTAAAATADSSRAFTASLLNAPYVGTQHGCIMDLQLVGSSNYTWILSPEAEGANVESSPSSSITYIITNLGSTRTCQAVFTFLPLEA